MNEKIPEYFFRIFRDFFHIPYKNAENKSMYGGLAMKSPDTKRILKRSYSKLDILLVPGNHLRLYIPCVGADHYFKVPAFPIILQITIIEFQQIRCDVKDHGLGFSCFQEYFLEALQFFNRTDDAADHVADIQLHGFVSVKFAGIGNSYRSL